jgi:uncharacterized protein
MDAQAPDWRPRSIADRLVEALADSPVVCVLGPRQSGKTSLIQRAFPERHYLTLDDAVVRQTAEADPAGFIASLPPPVTLDEVQKAPAVLSAMKMVVDRARRPGQFLLTGSANLLLLPSVSESLAGRLELVRLYPLTEAEKEGRPGGLLGTVLAGAPDIRLTSRQLKPSDLLDRVLRGGYPESLRRPRLSRLRQWHRDYLAALIERDARYVANLRTLDHLARLMTLLAHQTAQLLVTETLAKHLGIRRETVQNNLAALERLFLIRMLPAWHRNESRRVIKSPKVHILDTGLASTLAGLEPEDWTMHRERLGPMIESFVVQQLIAQAGWTDPELQFWHFRDKDQVEVDLVITKGRKTWGVEVKAGATLTSSDGRGLRRLAEQSGRDFQGGMILYAGASTVPTADPRVRAVPLSELWSR